MKTAAQKRISHRLASSARTDSGKIHIVTRKGAWVIKREGSLKALKVFSTKSEAVNSARNYLNKGSINKIVIHKKDGTISKII